MQWWKIAYMGNIGGGKIGEFGELWTICQFFICQLILFKNTGECFIAVQNFEFIIMAGLLNISNTHRRKIC